MRSLFQISQDLKEMSQMIASLSNEVDEITAVFAGPFVQGSSSKLDGPPLSKFSERDGIKTQSGLGKKKNPWAGTEGDRSAEAAHSPTLVQPTSAEPEPREEERDLSEGQVKPGNGRHDYSADPEKRLAELLESAGAIQIRSKNHLIFQLANGKKITIAKTPGDKRALLNTICNLKRIMT